MIINSDGLLQRLATLYGPVDLSDLLRGRTSICSLWLSVIVGIVIAFGVIPSVTSYGLFAMALVGGEMLGQVDLDPVIQQGDVVVFVHLVLGTALIIAALSAAVIFAAILWHEHVTPAIRAKIDEVVAPYLSKCGYVQVATKETKR